MTVTADRPAALADAPPLPFAGMPADEACPSYPDNAAVLIDRAGSIVHSDHDQFRYHLCRMEECVLLTAARDAASGSGCGCGGH